LKFIATIIAVADIAAVAWVEKGLMAVHTPMRELIGVGLVFASPVLGILLFAWLLRARAARAAAAVQRPVNPFGGGR
jgi:hypothetical protein